MTGAPPLQSLDGIVPPDNLRHKSVIWACKMPSVDESKPKSKKLPRSLPKHIARAKRQRNEMPLPELLLWIRLRPKVNKDFNFRRQASLLGRFTADFYVTKDKRRIVFEIDGMIHELHRRSDAKRDELFRKAGISVVRISARRVLANPDGVANLIRMICLGEIEIQDLE